MPATPQVRQTTSKRRRKADSAEAASTDRERFREAVGLIDREYAGTLLVAQTVPSAEAGRRISQVPKSERAGVIEEHLRAWREGSVEAITEYALLYFNIARSFHHQICDDLRERIRSECNRKLAAARKGQGVAQPQAMAPNEVPPKSLMPLSGRESSEWTKLKLLEGVNRRLRPDQFGGVTSFLRSACGEDLIEAVESTAPWEAPSWILIRFGQNRKHSAHLRKSAAEQTNRLLSRIQTHFLLRIEEAIRVQTNLLRATELAQGSQIHSASKTTKGKQPPSEQHLTQALRKLSDVSRYQWLSASEAAAALNISLSHVYQHPGLERAARGRKVLFTTKSVLALKNAIPILQE